MTNLTINRLNLLMATRRLMQVSPTSYNSELMLKAIDGKLALVAFGEGIIGIECLPDKANIDEDVVVNLEKFHVFLQVRYEDTINIKVNPKSVKLSAGSSSSTIGRSVLRLQAGIPDKSLFVGEIPSKAFDDLVRVANISDDKDMARPILGGVYLTITPGDIRAISANGIAFGYAREQGSGISTERKEKFLIKATAASAAQRYDWQGEPKIKIYRPSDSLKMMCFSNGLSYLYISELAEKEKFPIDYLLDGATDAVSDNYFTVDSGLFRSFVDAAVKSSGYDDRSVTVALANGKVMISSGKRLKPEIEEQGMEFVGFFEIMEAGSFGGDFIFCLDAKMAKQMMALLAQVDKGKLRVALGKRTKLIFFSTPMANALYGITQIARQ